MARLGLIQTHPDPIIFKNGVNFVHAFAAGRASEHWRITQRRNQG